MKRNHTTDKQVNIKANSMFPLVLVGVFVSIVIIVLVLIYRFYMSGFKKSYDYTSYDEYYVMISDNQRSSFMQNIYDSAYNEGQKKGVYVDFLGDNLPNNYTQKDLMQIAIASEVDGIILDADESEDMTELIDLASQKGIPVVTLLNDNTASKRCSFVGIGGYEIGREYGGQVIQIAKELRKQYFMSTQEAREEEIASIDVAILINSENNSASQNVIISGIREAVENDESSKTAANIRIVSVDNSNAFSVEESIRDIFNEEEVPAVIVCLDELSTTCVYQAVIDYNVVGKVNILGYYDSNTIINGIDRGVIYSTLSVDTSQLGEYCVTALNDYNKLGATSQYYTGDVTLINRNNVSSYLKEETVHE